MTYNTEKREELIRFLSERRGKPCTIEEICSAILIDGKGKSTVYRLIAKLTEEGSVRKITDEKSRRTTYQYIRSGQCAEHFHLKCRECKTVFHLDGVTSRAFEKKLKILYGFTLDEGALLCGICNRCKRAHNGGTV